MLSGASLSGVLGNESSPAMTDGARNESSPAMTDGATRRAVRVRRLRDCARNGERATTRE